MKTYRMKLLTAMVCIIFMAGCAGEAGGKNEEQMGYWQETGENNEISAGGQDERAQLPSDSAAGNDPSDHPAVENETENDQTENKTASAENGAFQSDRIICSEGMTLETRFLEPEGFVRPQAEAGSLAEFLRNYSLKEDKSPVLLYDGSEKRNQQAHAAVFALPIEDEDLQQCADSIMRVYAEYFWESGQQERIAFHFVSGFYAEYAKWRDGYRIQVDGNQVSWTREASYDDSYENLKKYLRYVFSYAGTLSMDAESEPISLTELQAGDVFLKGGSPGHVVLVVDLCENAQGRKAFLLAQGYMPAQEFHVLKNPLHDDDPWYYEDEMSFPLETPEYTFSEGSARRLIY